MKKKIGVKLSDIHFLLVVWGDVSIPSYPYWKQVTAQGYGVGTLSEFSNTNGGH